MFLISPMVVFRRMATFRGRVQFKYVSGVLNDTEALKLAAIIQAENRTVSMWESLTTSQEHIIDISGEFPGVIMCELIARSGNLQALKWARADKPSQALDKRARLSPFPWNSRTCKEAARHGHLELLIWAREHGCEWDSWTSAFAAKGGHCEMLKWA